MSETPRTDAHATPKGEDGTDWINADFARLLERELATLRKQLAERDAEIVALRGNEYRAGMRAAATVYPDPQFPGRLTQYQRGVLAGVMRFRDAILAEADK